jgi:hypothetical protein
VARRRLMLASGHGAGWLLRKRGRREIALVGALVLWVAVGLTGVGEAVDISGTFGFDVVAVPIPATLVDEIQLDTPGELTVFKFGMEAELDLNVAYFGANMHLNTAMSIPGLERLILDQRFYLGPLLIKPEMWLATPFETVTDINHFTNWVVIPPGDFMFVKLRCTLECEVGGLEVRNLFMLEDVTFPSPLEGFVPLQYPVQSQSFHTGDILTITAEPAPGVSLTSVTRFCATEATNVVKGWSGSGSVDADGSCCDEFYFNETLSLSGIQYCGMTLWFRLDVRPCDEDVLSLSGGGTLADILDIGLLGSFSLFPLDFSGFSLTATLCDSFTATMQFSESFELLQMSIRGQCAVDTGIMQGSAFAAGTLSGSGIGKAFTVGATLGHGTVSGGLSFAFSEQAGSLRLTGTTIRLEFKNAPASFTISAGFGRRGLAQAGFGVGISF